MRLIGLWSEPDDVDAFDRHRQFLGDELRLSRQHALPELALAGEGGDRVVGVDSNPRIELPGIDVRGASAKLTLTTGAERGKNERFEGSCTGEAHHQRAGGADEIASREVLCHARFSAAYRVMARNILVCAKQRQRTVESDC